MIQYGDITVRKKLLLDNFDRELEYMVDGSGHPPRGSAKKYVTANSDQGQDVSIQTVLLGCKLEFTGINKPSLLLNQSQLSRKPGKCNDNNNTLQRGI